MLPYNLNLYFFMKNIKAQNSERFLFTHYHVSINIVIDANKDREGYELFSESLSQDHR